MKNSIRKFSLVAPHLASTGKLWLIMLFLFAGSFAANSQSVLPYGYTWSKSSNQINGWSSYTFTYNTGTASAPYPGQVFAANSYGWDLSTGAYIQSIKVNHFEQSFTTTISGTYAITAKLDLPEFANWGTAISVTVVTQNSAQTNATIQFGTMNGPYGSYLETTPNLNNYNYYGPGAPYSLSSNSITSTSFCASWAAGNVSATQPAPTSYKYWVTTAGGATVVGVTPVGGTSVCVSGLSPNTSYNFYVVGVNSIGDGYSSVKSVTTMNQIAQTITFNPNPLPDKTYGDADFSVSATAPGGTVTFSSSNTTIATVSGTTVHIIKAGTVNIYADQAGSTNYYAAPRVTRSLTINPKALTVDISGVTTSNKVYDGNTSTAYTGALPVGIVGSDVVTLVQSGTFADKNVADGISIVPAMSLTGTNAANYTLTQPVLAGSANITPKELTVSSAVAQNKIYDTNTDAIITGATLVGKVGSDDVTLATATAGTFDDANVANGINVTPAMTITGSAIGNYTLTQPTLSANITKKELTVSGAVATNKTYDSTTDADITGATLVGVLNSEDVVLATETAGTFAIPTVANNINVVPAMTITGAGIANYSLTQPTLSANIAQKELTVTGEVADNKVYDSNTNATFTGASLVGVFNADVASVTLSPVGQFDDANIATGLVVTPNMSISGARSTNYSLTQPANTTADITAQELTVSGAVAGNKIYNGDVDAVISGATLVGVVGSEDVVLDTKTAGTFVSTEVANGISVTPVMTITGSAIGNYTLTQPTLSANITPKELTVTGAVANNKIYESTTDATFSGATLVGIVGTDDVVLEPNGTFANKNKGTGITITPVMTISGTKAGNYSITQPVLGATASITAKELTVSGAVAANKVYDTNTDASISGATLAGVIGSEDVLLATATAGVFADLNVANNISVATAMTIIGTEISNYTLTQPVLSANITKAPLMITLITASSKDYDGSTFATLTDGTLTGVLGSDVVTITPGSADFSDKNVGNGKAVTASGYRLAGSEAHNYLLSVQPLVSSADIYSAPLTITGVTAANKVYDANTTAVLSGGSLVGIQGSDNVTITLGTGTFTDKTIGTGKTVTAAGYGLTGSEASNYNLTAQPDGIKADINVAPLSVSGVTAASKVYDGTTLASLSGGSLVGVQASDNVSITAGTGSFVDKNTGTGKVVAANGYALAGTDAVNYSLIAQPGDLSADITVAQLNVAAENKTKTYGSQNPQLTLTYSGFLNGDNIQNITAPSITCLATVASKAGDYDISLSGGSASNYNLAFTKGNLQITKAALKVTAENKTRLFGSANPEFTFTYEGFVNNEAAAALATQPIASTTANTISIPGDYQIIVSGGSSDNYSLSYNNGNLMVKALAGDTNGDGKIVSPEIVGDTNGDGKITPPEIAGDRNGDGTIGDDEKTGDKDGNGKIGDGETTGDKDGDGKVDNGGIAGDINGDGKITPPEIAGDTNGDGKITPHEVTGDTNGDGKIDGKEIAGDSTGTGTIKPGGIAGDTNGDGKITPPEVAGDTNGDGKITPPEVAGDTNGDGKIGAGETTGDKDGDGKVDVGGIAGDINGDGKITPPEIAGDINGDGKITPPEVAGDTNGDGKIGAGETTGDKDGDGKVDVGGIAGDINGDGKITPPEIAGDTNGDGKINGSEIAGDKDGNGKIDGNEIAGDTNGDGVISATEIVGDVNGDGKINSDEVAGDKNGDKQIGSSETRVINPAKDHINVNHLFSPNGDGYNDYWIIPEIEKYGRISLKIYDRWGSIVFESKNYQNDWDGTSKGKLVPEGAYFFFIKSDKLSDKTGAINIIR